MLLAGSPRSAITRNQTGLGVVVTEIERETTKEREREREREKCGLSRS